MSSISRSMSYRPSDWLGRSAKRSCLPSARCIAAAAYLGFRESEDYGGQDRKDGNPRQRVGLSLGTAMAISGAAVSPNMGYHSSPSIALLLTLFNVRLGWWLGNPGKAGKDTYTSRRSEMGRRAVVRRSVRPDHRRQSLRLSVRRRPFRKSRSLRNGAAALPADRRHRCRLRSRFRLRGSRQCGAKNLHRSRHPDHVQRPRQSGGPSIGQVAQPRQARCRGACDYSCGGQDQKERRTRQQDRPPRRHALSRHRRHPLPGGRSHQACRSRRDRRDRRDCRNRRDHRDRRHCRNRRDPGASEIVENGYILYIKPAYHGTEKSAGIRSYATANPTFPHETTADQWFTELQFESYRSLGLDIGSRNSQP